MLFRSGGEREREREREIERESASEEEGTVMFTLFLVCFFDLCRFDFVLVNFSLISIFIRVSLRSEERRVGKECRAWWWPVY